MNSATPPSRSVTLTSGRTCTPTLYCQEEPPCTQVLLIVCRRRSQPWLPAPSRSKSSPHQRESTPAGSEDPSSHHSPHSNRCGSQKLSMTNPAHPSSTENASKCCLKMTSYRLTSQPRLQSEGRQHQAGFADLFSYLSEFKCSRHIYRGGGKKNDAHVAVNNFFVFQLLAM